MILIPVYVLGVSRGFGFLEFKSVSDAQDWMERHRVGIHVHVVFFFKFLQEDLLYSETCIKWTRLGHSLVCG